MANVLAVDLGKTGCRVALWIGEVRTDAEGPGAPGLASPGGMELAEVAVLAVAVPLLRAAGVSRLDAACIGAAGALAAPEAARKLARRLGVRLPAARIAVASDAITSHAGALDGGPGLVLSIGTGAVAMAIRPDGSRHKGDGLGPWLGDEGGGAWIGLQGMRAALRAIENRGPPTALREAASARFGADLAARVEGDANPTRLAAGFAGDVADAARAGDAVALTLIRRAAGCLADTVRAAASGWPGPGPIRFVVTGGLLELGSILIDPLSRALRDCNPPLDFTTVHGTALDGARLLAGNTASLHERHVFRAVAGHPAEHSLDLLETEGLRPGLEDLDQRSPAEIIHLVLDAERAAQGALSHAAPQLAAAAEAVTTRMLAGGRLFYLGAGTPGRLATLDAAELGPTYSAPPDLVVALLAGGPGAMIHAVEGAEDDAAAAAIALDAHGLSAGDAVVGITASGRTPYVVGGLCHARARGALTVAIVNNPASPAAGGAEIAVEILTGAEIVAGSTRMTAGTVQKVALNAISTAAMVALGKTFGARMVDVRATNDKLRRRALRMVREITGADEATAAAALAATGNRVKPALVMLLGSVDAAEAEQRLLGAGGRVRNALSAAIAGQS